MVSEDVSLGRSVAEEQEWPPGFRFHPTDEELVLYYLKRKICRKKLKLSIIAETDVYKSDPEELPGLSLLKTGDRQWFFFSPRDRKYPNGARSNRATKQGYWKATGKDRIITCGSRSVGLKKTLVFYRGRAPNGERTDWVMHEYTLDEEEFKRCQNVQGYYALYKVFKKSGAGPKNGEQYGAPFREEDWNDDCPDFNNPASLDISGEKVDENLPHAVTNVVNCQVTPFLDDIDEFMKKLTEDCLADLPPINGCAYTPSEVLSHEDVRKTTMDVPCRDIAIQEPVSMLYANGVQRNLEASFNLSHVTVSEIETYEVSNIASTAAKFGEQEVFVLPEEDFLEMDDLLGPEPIKSNVEEEPNDFLVDERDGLNDFDLYQDAAMFLNDMGAGPSEVANHYEYFVGPNQHGLGEVHPPSIQVPGGIVNQPYLEVADPLNNHLYLNSADQINNQFYSDDASQSQSQGSVLTSAEIYNGIGNYLDPNSGVAYESSDISFQLNQNQGGDEVNGATSWFSSAVWSFVESIPTTPASAAENALVNRAFERMSSFSRLRMNAITASTPADSDSEPAKKSRNRGFIFFPILVAVLAIFWVVLGAVSVWTPGISA